MKYEVQGKCQNPETALGTGRQTLYLLHSQHIAGHRVGRGGGESGTRTERRDARPDTSATLRAPPQLHTNQSPHLKPSDVSDSEGVVESLSDG